MAILTISREIGTEGLKIGKTIAEEMGYDYFDKDRIIKELKTDGPKWGKLGEELDERRPTLWEKYDWQYWAFVTLTKNHILKRACADNVVIIGRGGNFLLDGITHALRVRIIAPMDMRLKTVTDESSGNYISSNTTAAKKLLEKGDKERVELMRTVFNRNWSDPKSYDLTVNMQSISREEVELGLTTLLKERNKRKDAAGQELLMMRALAAKIHSVIATTPTLLVPTLEVLPMKEEIVVKGVVHSAKEHRLIEEKAAELAGSIPVRCNLHYR